MAHAGVVFLNQRRRLAGLHVRQEVVHQRAQAHRHHAGFDVREQKRVPVGGGVAHKVEHHALAHHAHGPEQEQRPFTHKAKTHHVEGEDHQRHDRRPLRQVADDNYHFDAVERCAEDKLLRHVAVKHRHQRQQHDRVDHEKHAVAGVVEARNAQRNHPGKDDAQGLAKVVCRVDDVAVRGKHPRQGANRHSEAGSPGGSASRRRSAQTALRCCRAARSHGRRSADASAAPRPASRECACAERRVPSG